MDTTRCKARGRHVHQNQMLVKVIAALLGSSFLVAIGLAFATVQPTTNGTCPVGALRGQVHVNTSAIFEWSQSPAPPSMVYTARSEWISCTEHDFFLKMRV